MSVVYITVCTKTATLRCPYNPSVVETIKRVVPSALRSWEAPEKAWKVHVDWVDSLAAELRQGGHTVRKTVKTAPPPPPPRSAPMENWANALMDAVGPARIEPVHRALTRVLHPDVAGGDTVLMQQLNAARDQRLTGRRAA